MKCSRLLLRLDQEIAAAKTRLEADCLRGQEAVYFARLGHKKRLAEVLSALHQRYDMKPVVAVSVWVNLAEGLAIYYEDMGSGSYDRIRRAHALSVAAGIKPLHALTAAWMAQMHYMRHEIEKVAAHLHEVFRISAPDHHAARSRAAIVAAQALHHAGRLDLAAKWHRIAKDHATEEGDDATIGALMHNMAWLGMLAWRNAVLTGHGSAVDGKQAMLGAESTGNFDRLVGAASWRALEPVLRAQLLSLKGDVSGALALYERHLPAAQQIAATRLQANLYADKAWCHAQAGNADAARVSAATAEGGIAGPIHVDDRAAAHSRLAQVYERLGDEAGGRRHAELAVAAWRENEVFQAHTAGLLAHLSEGGVEAAPPAASDPPVQTTVCASSPCA
jgi:hypothetical protein